MAAVISADAAHGAPGGMSIDGRAVIAKPLDVITTPSGNWPVDDLGAVYGGRAYRFRFAQNTEWYSICIVRYPTGETSIDDHVYEVAVGGRRMPISALPGSMKCTDTGEPVEPSPQRLLSAVRAGRVLPYARAAFAGFPPPRTVKTTGLDATYRPDRIYGRSSSNNAIGMLAGAGGEYPSSRGFISETDALMILAAIAGDNDSFHDAAKRARIETLYGLSVPNLVIWSERNQLLRDPQRPFPGDRAYANEGNRLGIDNYGNEGRWTVPEDYPYLAEIGAEPGKTYQHTRDEAHLFNHGYAYWLATGDPRAAILQEAIGAYALAATYVREDDRYVGRFQYQRTTLNQFSALWKLRDIAANVEPRNGKIFWPAARIQKMVTDVWAGWKQNIAALDRSTRPQDRSVAIFRGIDSNEDNAYSNFMMAIYGSEAAYLWASAGRPELLRRLAENHVLRFGGIGGARGVYGIGTGSGFPILVKGEMPYRDRQSFIDWVNANSANPNDSFDGASPHTVMRGYWTLRLARDAIRRNWMTPINGLDSAISRTERARDATSKWRYSRVVSWKHGGADFGMIDGFALGK